MDTKITKKDINLLIGVAGVATLVLVGFLVVKPTLEKTDKLKKDNDDLKPKIEELIAINARLPEYEAALAEYKIDNDKIMFRYPSFIDTKDSVMYWANMANSNNTNLVFGNLDIDDTQLVDLSGEEDENSATVTYDEEGNPVTAEADIKEGSVDGLSLYRTPLSIDMACTYEGMKDLFAYINEQPVSNSIDRVDLSYDETTGALRGSMGLSRYFISGGDKQYEPEHIPNVPTGVPDVFNTFGEGNLNELMATGGGGASGGYTGAGAGPDSTYERDAATAAAGGATKIKGDVGDAANAMRDN